MRRIMLLIVILAVVSTGCSAEKKNLGMIGEESAKQQYKLADSSKWEKEEDSPEWLALYSSKIYKGMLDQTITCEEGLEAVKTMATKASAEQLGGMEAEFKQDILSTIESLKNNDDDKIKDFHFSQCMKDENYKERYTIYRIQEMESGKLYYFKQDFIQEKGEWKVYGDNVENPFVLK